MSWIPLLIGSAVALGFHDVCKKHAVHHNSVMRAMFWSCVAGTIAMLAAQGFTGHVVASATMGWDGFWRVVLKSAIVTGSWIAGDYALRSLPISIAAPIRGSQPVVTLAGALLLFRERPSPLQWAGIAVTLIAYFLFSILGRREGIHFHRNKGIGLIFLATILGAVSSLYDKYILQKTGLTPEAVQFWFEIDLTVLLGVICLIQSRAGLSRTPFRFRWTVPAVGVLLVASDWCYFTVLAHPDALLAIVSPVRRSNVVIAFLVGGLIYKDKNRRRKAVALSFVVLGVILLCLAQIYGI
jgi:drug/metabolite transporter (DMT)-like permease